MKLSSTIDIEPLDISGVPSLVHEVVSRLRALNFRHGAVVHPRTGERHEGLSNASNSHPRVGSAYTFVSERSVPADATPTGASTTVSTGDQPAEYDITHIQLVKDSREILEVHASMQHEPSLHTEVCIERPSAFHRADARLHIDIPGHRLLRGTVDARAHLDLDNWGTGAEAAPLVAGTFRHRRARGTFDLTVTDDGLGRWVVAVACNVRGRGWIRPIAAIVGVFARPVLQRTIFGDGSTDRRDGPSSAEELAEMLAELEERTPAVVADDVIADIVSSAVMTLPTPE